MIEQVKTRKRNWHTLYRLVLKKDETLQEVASYRLTLLNIYILISSILLIAVGLTTAIIFFTPLKKLIPGFAEPTNHPEYLRLTRKITALEEELTSYKLYYENFRKILAPEEENPGEPLPEDTGTTDGNSMPGNGGSADAQSGEDLVTPPATLNIGSSPTRSTLLNSADYKYLMPPISGVISSKFDAATNHIGVDILAPHDTPVKSIWDGHVITADWTLETGYTIGIQHNNDIVSFYKHNASLLKRAGAFVRAGEAIAIVGNTGKLTSGPHLHFELWVQGKPVDPTRYIDF